MRIAIAECKQEVSTFNPVPSSFDDFRVVRGEEMIRYHRSVGEEIGGFLNAAEQDDIDIVPCLGTSSNTSGGVLTAKSFKRLSDAFLTELERAGTVDAVYFALHGAMQAEGENDPEGYLLEQSRAILGHSIPFIVSLDLHGIVTDKMLSLSDAVIIYHTYPHVDFYETGARSAAVLKRVVKDNLKPTTARVKIPALVRGNEMITDSGAIKLCVDRAKELENDPRVLSAGVMWGNPFTDVPELRSNALVVAVEDAEFALKEATGIAQTFWDHHEKMQVELSTLEEAAKETAKVSSGTVILMDAADATSSGASGDSNAIVAELLKQGYGGTVLAPVVDPKCVELAFQAGVSGDIETTVGGQMDSARYRPLPIKGTVRMLSDGRFRSESFGWHWDSGPTAVIQSGNVTWVVGTRPVSLFDRSWFYANGQDPKRFDCVIVKSPHCESHMFADWCSKLIDVDAPGSTSANLPSLGHTICQRPIFPLDPGVQFNGESDTFRRD